MERGQYLPELRLNEVILVIVVGALYVRLLIDDLPLPRRSRLDVAIFVLAVAGSVIPVGANLARGRALGLEDVLFALTLWKLATIYAVVRITVRTPVQVMRAMYLSVAVAVVVALVAVLDSLNLFGVANILNAYGVGTVEAVVDDGRGGSTIGTPIGLGVYLVISLLIAMALLHNDRRYRLPLQVGIGAILLGIFGSGQVGSGIALIIGVVAYGLVSGQFGAIAKRGVPLMILAVVALWPVAQTRAEDFGGSSLVPPSWSGRWENLGTFVLTRFGDPVNVLLGVSLEPRIPSPLDFREFVFIESGYLWLLWVGGIPFLVAFIAFVVVALRATRAQRETEPGPLRAAGLAAAAAIWVVALTQTFDPHLTIRGTAEVFFPLLALGSLAVSRQKTAVAA